MFLAHFSRRSEFGCPNRHGDPNPVSCFLEGGDPSAVSAFIEYLQNRHDPEDLVRQGGEVGNKAVQIKMAKSVVSSCRRNSLHLYWFKSNVIVFKITRRALFFPGNRCLGVCAALRIIVTMYLGRVNGYSHEVRLYV